MRDIYIASAQFEARDADVDYNFSRIESLARQAVDQGAEIVSFHECSISGYTFLQTLSRDELAALAEIVPDGPGTRRLMALAKQLQVGLGAGLIERDGDRLYNCYIMVGPEGFVARHRKIHAFISPHLSWGNEFQVFDFLGIRASILTCYDNNLAENARVATLLGAEVIFAPHVTGGLESPMPGRGKIARSLWDNRLRDPVRLRQEFEGPKGRGWIMRWLPARAWENGVYYVYSNAVGVDHDTVKPGGAMILDPYGEVLVESRALGDDVVTAFCTAEKIPLSGGQRYLRARRPELYAQLTKPLPPGQESEVSPGWRVGGDITAPLSVRND